jgi:hypothetical protein
MINETKLELACSHYKDSYDVHLATIKQRDLLFYALLAITAFFSLQITSLELANTTLTELISNSSGVKISKDSRLLSSLVWFLLLGASTRYFQLVLQIEREYRYLHSMEEYLGKYYPGTTMFSREGAAYLQRYPMFSNWVWFLYTIAFPSLLLAAITIRIKAQIQSTSNLATIGFDIAAFFLIGTSVALYLIRMHGSWLAKRVRKLWCFGP